MNTKVEQAVENFEKGFNCSQVVWARYAKAILPCQRVNNVPNRIVTIPN